MIYSYKGQRVNIEVSGEGCALLLLHGWGCDNTIYNNYRELLSSSYRVYAFDLPGFGASDEPSNVWGTQDYVDMLRCFVEENSIQCPTLVGHSFGGRVSILYASQHSVQKMILIDSAGIVPSRSAKYYFKVYSFKTMRWFCELLFSKQRSQQILDHYRGKSGSSDYNNASPKMRAILSKVVNEELRGVMPKIEAPTLLFWGNLDTATPLSDAKIMEKLIPDAGLVVASGCSHFSFLENRALFEAVVKNFLNIK